jgi:hypothetical protein
MGAMGKWKFSTSLDPDKSETNNPTKVSTKLYSIINLLNTNFTSKKRRRGDVARISR